MGILRWALAGVFIAAWFAGCTPGSHAPQQLAGVGRVPKPTLPPWIVSISPTDRAQSLAQIRVIFAKPVAKVESLEGNGPADVLSHVRLDPDLPGHFVLLTPRMLGFVAERALPIAARVKVTLTAGLRDLEGDALASDLAWSFETAPLAFDGLPNVAPTNEPSAPPDDLRPSLRINANAQVDVASLAEHAHLHSGVRSMDLDAQPAPTPSNEPTPDEAQRFDASQASYAYVLRPRGDLEKGTTYQLSIDPGVQPAIGNVASSDAFTGSLRTYGALAVVPTPAPSGPPQDSRFAGGDPVVTFTNPLDPSTIEANVTVSPAPQHLRVLPYPDAQEPTGVAIDPYALEPDRDYTITVAAGLKDKFGQLLGSQQTIAVYTGDFRAGAWAPSGRNIFPAGSGVKLNFYGTNVPNGVVRSAFRPLAPVQLLQDVDSMSVLAPMQHWSRAPIPSGRTNEQRVVTWPLDTYLHGAYGALAYGIATDLDAKNPTASGTVQLTNMGVFVQVYPQHGVVFVQHLNDGSPAHARVQVYRLGQDGAAPQACAQGETSNDGSFELRGVDVERCYVSASPGEAPAIGVVASEAGDNATLTAQPYSGAYAYDLPTGWVSGKPLSRGTVFPDRDLYQPGERAQLTGIAYYVRGDAVVADRNATYDLVLRDPNGNDRSIGKATSDAYGVFSIGVPFSKQQPLGYYTIKAVGPNGNELYGNLRVAEFKPPNFKLALTLDKTSATAGSQVSANVAASYLFGAPLQGGKAKETVSREVALVAPKDRERYWFGRQWFWPEEPPSVQTDVFAKDATLDADGRLSFPVSVASDLPFPMTYRVDVETSDVSNLSVADSKTFLALPSDAVIGLASDTVAAAGSDVPVRVIVTNADGAAIRGRGVHLELQKMTYVWASRASEGGEAAHNSVKYDTVAQADVTSGDTETSVTLKPPQSGAYRVRANFAGAKSDATETDLQLFVFGTNAADFGGERTAVKIALDKKKYKVGDTASVLVASPYETADIYLAVVRNDVIYHTMLRGVRGAAHANVRITQQMLPNAAIEALVVRRSGPATDMLSRFGMSAFNVDLADRYMTVAIAPANAKVAPGGSQRVAFTVTDTHHRPVRGKIVAMAVNDAILQLSGYRLPDLVQTVFGDQPISTRFADSRADVTLTTQTPPSEKGYGYGGGFLEGAASTRVRAHFSPSAYYGALDTDAQGRASATFTLPDDLTTWRVMAVAIAADDAHFGTSDATFIAALPLMANPLLPQFARPNDRFNLGASIANQTGAAGSLDLLAQLTGALRFASGDPASLKTTQSAATGMQALTFPVVAGTPAPSTVKVTASLGSASDAFTVPFELRDRATTESVIESGAAAARTDIPVAFEQPGTVQITVANSVAPQFALPADRAMSDDAFDLTDTAAARLTVASALGGLVPKYHLRLRFDPKTSIERAVRAILSAQRGDGGFAPWPNANMTDPFDSAYALGALAFARAHGVAVNGAAFDRAKRFASQTLANPGRFDWCTSQECKRELRFAMLDALAQAGDRRSDFLGTIAANADSFDSATQIRLARYLLATPGYESQGAVLADRLQQTVYVTGRYSVANVTTRWGWLGTSAQAQAEMLHLLLQRHAPPEQLDGAVRALVAQQCRCGWPTLTETAAALRALDAYAATESLVPMRVAVDAGSTTIGSANFTGGAAQTQTFSVPSSQVHGGTIAIVPSGGTVHYTLLYTYDVPSDAPGTLTAFRVTREVRAAGERDVLATMDLAPVKDAVSLGLSRVYDVGVRFAVDHPVDRVEIEDPLPAGLEAVDATFQTTSRASIPQGDSWQIDDRQIFKDRVVGFASHLGAGVYEMHYLARSVTEGEFAWPGTRVYLANAPEEFGRAAMARLRTTRTGRGD